MTAALTCYSAVFMRYAFAVTPANYLLFGCHFINFGSQTTQGYRFLQYWHMGGREKVLEQKGIEAKREGQELAMKAEGIVNQVKDEAGKAVDKAKSVVGGK